MDNLTHSLFGLTLARTPLGRTGTCATAVLLIASNAPDIDILAAAGGTASYLAWHRGPTHGPRGGFGLGLLCAGAVWIGRRAVTPNPSAPALTFMALWGLAILGVLCHVLMDLPTVYGTRMLAPFSWTWWSEDWMPIVDVYLLAVLGAGLWFGRAPSPGRARWATVALALMVANYGIRAGAHRAAIRQAPSVFGAQFPPRCPDRPLADTWIEHWPRAPLLAPGLPSRAQCLVEIAAMPDFLSPFRWRLIALLSDAYEVRSVNLVARRTVGVERTTGPAHYPNAWSPVVGQAATAPVAQVFLGFSRFPTVETTLDGTGRATVRWTDLRFVVEGLPARDGPVPTFPGATVEVGRDGAILRERLGS